MKRRDIVKAFPFFGIAAASTALSAEKSKQIDLDAQVMYHVEQIKKIRMVQYPQIKHWHLTDPSLLKGCQGEGSIILMADIA